MLNNDVLSTLEQHNATVEAVLSDNGREFCGREDQHPYELFLQFESITHKRSRVSRPQSNGIVERLHRTLLDEHFRVEGRKTWFETIEEMQTGLDAYLVSDNTNRPHQGRGMNGRTPACAFVRGIPKTSRKEGAEDLKTAAKTANVVNMSDDMFLRLQHSQLHHERWISNL